MRVRLEDSGRARAAGLLVALLGGVLFAVGWVCLVDGLAGAQLASTLGTVLMLLALPVARLRTGVVERELTLGPSRVELRASSSGSTRSGRLLASLQARFGITTVTAGELTGGSTAHASSGGREVSLAVVRRRRPYEPVVLIFDRADEAERVRRALGIGHFGRGAVAFRTAIALDQAVAVLSALAAALLAAFVGILATFDVAFTAQILLLVVVVPMTIALYGIHGYGRRIVLTPTAVEIFDGRRLKTQIPYDRIASVTAAREGLYLTTREGETHLEALRVGHDPLAALTRGERDQLVEQLRSASERAYGRTQPHDDVTARLDALRRNDQPLDAWLARLDTLGAQLGHETGYRAAPIASDDLWKALADPDAELVLRSAAARVLGGSVRIATDAATTERSSELRLAADALLELAEDDADADVVARVCDPLLR